MCPRCALSAILMYKRAGGLRRILFGATRSVADAAEIAGEDTLDIDARWYAGGKFFWKLFQDQYAALQHALGVKVGFDCRLDHSFANTGPRCLPM